MIAVEPEKCVLDLLLYGVLVGVDLATVPVVLIMTLTVILSVGRTRKNNMSEAKKQSFFCR